MRNFILIFGWIIVSLTACQKDRTVAPAEPPRDRALRKVLRIVQEGAAMLEDSETTRSAFVRRIDPSGVTCRVVPGTRAGAAAEDIALLFREIGVRADIEYAPGGSGASTQNARHGFAAFGYDQNPARNYTFADVRKDLDAGRPLYMRGEADFVDANGNVARAGHAWVADGYKFRYHYIREYKDHDYGREYFRNETIPCQYIHINWGYDGNNNGYFQDNVFDLAKGYEYDMPYYDPTSMHFKYNVLIITQIRNTK